MDSKHIELQIKKEIVEELNILIDRYKKEGLSLKDLRNYLKNNNAIKTLINDINEIGRKNFDNDEDYRKFVVKIVKDVIYDRISEEETNKLQENMDSIRKFSDFEYQKESLDTNELSAEYLFNDIGFAQEDMDILADYFKTNKEFIQVKSKDFCVYTLDDFNTDITRNNRVKTDILLLSDSQIQKMKENVNNKILSGIYNLIPQEVQYMGVQVKPHTVLDKQRIKDAIKVITEKNILEVITNVTKYKYIGKIGENYFIWKKEK